MNTQSPPCPACGATNAFVANRGYSLLNGILGLVFVSGIAAIFFGAIWAGIIGLLCGFIGSSKPACTCMQCNRKFTVSDAIQANKDRASGKVSGLQTRYVIFYILIGVLLLSFFAEYFM